MSAAAASAAATSRAITMRPGDAQDEVALLEDQERILEEEPESRVHDKTPFYVAFS